MISQARLEAFVGKKAGYYNEKWESLGFEKTSYISFNWAACFGGIFWLLYRKLYSPLLIVILVITLDVSLFSYLETAEIVSAKFVAIWDSISNILYGLAMGSFGNYWYLRKFQKLDASSKNHSPDPSIQEDYLKANGGTNAAGLWAVIVLLLSILAFVIYQES